MSFTDIENILFEFVELQWRFAGEIRLAKEFSAIHVRHYGNPNTIRERRSDMCAYSAKSYRQRVADGRCAQTGCKNPRGKGKRCESCAAMNREATRRSAARRKQSGLG